jgi:hypothetical protein
VTTSRTSDVWWKNGLLYCLDVETFLDSSGDGRGDFLGLTERVDYLAGTGVTCIWLMPFYPSPNRDDGYDVTDYYAVDPRLGSLGDFVAFVRTARDRGLRVIVDLVVNHTSDQHDWFRKARASRTSPYRDWYVWADVPPEQPTDDVVFPDAEDSIWSWDKRAQQWYLHHFYSHQPDLNIANPAVLDEIAKIAGFWLQVGVDGFRVDAVPYLIETGGTDVDGELALDPHELLRDLRSFMSRRRGDSVLLAEARAERCVAGPERLRRGRSRIGSGLEVPLEPFERGGVATPHAEGHEWSAERAPRQSHEAALGLFGELDPSSAVVGLEREAHHGRAQRSHARPQPELVRGVDPDDARLVAHDRWADTDGVVERRPPIGPLVVDLPDPPGSDEPVRVRAGVGQHAEHPMRVGIDDDRHRRRRRARSLAHGGWPTHRESRRVLALRGASRRSLRGGRAIITIGARRAPPGRPRGAGRRGGRPPRWFAPPAPPTRSPAPGPR